MTTIRKQRESYWGACLAQQEAIKSGSIALSNDALKVTPLQSGDSLWEFCQPLLSKGGHIIGAPVPAAEVIPQKVSDMGMKILKGLQEGMMYRANKPEYSIPLLWVLLSTLPSSRTTEDLKRELTPVLAYAKKPEADFFNDTSIRERFLERHQKYPAVAEVLGHENGRFKVFERIV